MKDQAPDSRKNEVQCDFHSQLSTIKIQTYSILLNKQNQNLISLIPQKKNPPLSFSLASFI
jgi:hypothetical protein